MQYLCAADAARAIVDLNGKEINKREIAIDWVMPKEAVEKEKKGEGEEEEEDGEENDKEEDKEKEEEEEEEEEAEEEEKEEEEEEEEGEEEEGGNHPEDVEEGKTIFIRNLGYRTDKMQLFEGN